jgi:hypothetical protein
MISPDGISIAGFDDGSSRYVSQAGWETRNLVQEDRDFRCGRDDAWAGMQKLL